MKLHRLDVAGFGPLRGEWVFDPSRVTVIADDNERGKSSLLCAVSAALYGLENDRRSHRVATPLDRWRPWEGGAFGVALEIESKGERYTIRRDFERGTVEVWNDRGQEVTAEFREGKDEFPVGKVLLGLEVEEFEKCAFVRQGELDLVVPGDEKTRRNGTLHGKLESAADTRAGDTSATVALQVLEEALRRYNCAELEFTGTVDVALQRLEAKRGLLEAEAHTLEHGLARISEPLAQLARLGEEETAARAGLTALEQERTRAGAVAIRRQLREDEARRVELEILRAEAERVASCAHLPPGAEAELRETLARHDEAKANLAALEGRRVEGQSRGRSGLESEMRSHEAYATGEPADADRLIALAAELRRGATEESRLRGEVAALRETLAGRGFDPERAQRLNVRFGALDEARQRLLRGQADLQLAFQTEVASLEQVRTESTERLREMDRRRNALRLPGWVLLALGLSAGVSGGVLAAMRADTQWWIVLLSTAGALVLLGIVLLVAGDAGGKRQHTEALRHLTDAQRRLSQLRTQRAETEISMSELAEKLGYRDARELAAEWNEYLGLHEESASLRHAHEQLMALEQRRGQMQEEAKKLLARAGGGEPDPEHLDRVADGIRRHVTARQRLSDLDKSWTWIDEEKNVAEATVRGLLEKAMRIMHTAGLAFDTARPWPEQVAELSERVRGRERHGVLVNELIPNLERQRLPVTEAEELRVQLAGLEAEIGSLPDADPVVRTALELDRETRRQHAAIDELSRRRQELQLTVDDVCRRHGAEHPEKLLQIERIDVALARARRFKRAVEMACEAIQAAALDTHRKWADWLNHRVGQILHAMGSGIVEVRFGEDLDFSVRTGRQQLARGKAVIQLSAGARDQLHLAIRLAISEFLSRRDDPLPLLVDDAFASSDDDRARAGLKLLIDGISAGHQILLVTCHRQRIDHLARLDPELYAARVQRLEMRPAGAPRA